MKSTKVKSETTYTLELTEKEFITILSSFAQVKPVDSVHYAETKLQTKLETNDFYNFYEKLLELYNS